MIFVWLTPPNFAEMQRTCQAHVLLARLRYTAYFILSANRPQLTVEAILEKDLHSGTLTVGLDSAEGMLLDELYESEIRTFRHKKRKLCELSKLAIDPSYSSTKLLASLINLAYVYARTIHRADDAFIEVNPRHASTIGVC